jgi:FtsZ-binding cell division protein ZapB
MSTLRLKNGIEFQVGFVATIIMELKDLKENDPELFEAVVRDCRSESSLTREQQQLLQEKYAVGASGRPSGGFREVVKCAVDDDFNIGSPAGPAEYGAQAANEPCKRQSVLPKKLRTKWVIISLKKIAFAIGWGIVATGVTAMLYNFSAIKDLPAWPRILIPIDKR